MHFRAAYGREEIIDSKKKIARAKATAPLVLHSR